MKKNNLLTILEVVFFLFSAVMLYKGYDKMTKYSNPDDSYSWKSSKNAYVGGDAYNFIINGTYATSYFVLASAGIISGVICIVSNQIIDCITHGDRDVNWPPTNNSNTTGTFNSTEALNKLSDIASGKVYQDISAGEWVCPSCGKRNRSFDDICSCGQPKK